MNFPVYVSKGASGSIIFSFLPMSSSDSGSEIFLEAFFESEQVSKTFPISLQKLSSRLNSVGLSKVIPFWLFNESLIQQL